MQKRMQVKEPLVSLVICAYNASKSIGDTLQSVIDQSYKNLDVLVIDDCSNDATVAIVRALAEKDARIRILKNSTNLGTAGARQRGLVEARSSYVMFLDSDDIALPELVRRLYQKLTSDSQILGVGCYASYFSSGEEDLGIQKVGPESKEEFFLQYSGSKMTFMVPVTMFRKEDALSVGGYRQDVGYDLPGIRYQDFAEDLDLWCRMSDLGRSDRYFLTLPEVLFRYRKPLDSLSTKNIRHMQLKMRWIKNCLRRRRAGEAERTLGEFVSSRTIFDRFLDMKSDAAALYYKRCGFAYARRRYLTAIFYGICSGAMSPKLIRQKIKTQFVKGR